MSCSSAAVTCCQTGMILHVRLVLLGEEIIPVGTREIPIASSANDVDIVILGLTFSPSGILSFIGMSSMPICTYDTLVYRVTDSRGIWATYQLASLNSSLVSTPVSEHLHLQRFSILKSKWPSARNNFSVVSLGTSLVLLAAAVEGTPDLSLQIWDLSYGVLLTTQLMPVPSAFRPARIRLTLADEGQVLLTVSPAHNLEKGVDPKRSSIHIVPVDPRLRSNLATALGKTALTAEWLIPNTSNGQKPEEDNESAKIISDIQDSLQNKNVQQAEQAFFKWIDSHSVRMPPFHMMLLLMTGTVKGGCSWS